MAILKFKIDTGYGSREQLVESMRCWLIDELQGAMQSAIIGPRTMGQLDDLLNGRRS